MRTILRSASTARRRACPGARQTRTISLSPPWASRRGRIGRNAAGAGAAAARVSRIPPGHPEGYLEGFATIYSEVAQAILAAREGRKPPAEVMFPTVEDGVKGMAFIEAALASSRQGGAWVAP